MNEAMNPETMWNVDSTWIKNMGKRENLLSSGIPHYPILVEHIPLYISQPDYQSSFLKTLQTIGEIIPESERWGKIATLTPGRDDRFSVNFDSLRLQDLYVEELYNVHSSIWEKQSACKVFGILQDRESGVTLEVTHFTPVDDLEGSLETMSFLSTIAHCKYPQYGEAIKDKDHLKAYWENSKKMQKRLVKK